MAMFSRIVGRKVVEACLLEASSFPKPGNVWRGKRVGGLEYEDFVRAAKAIKGACEKAADRKENAGLGELILLAARSAVKKVGEKNANAGIILLLVPLCAAFARVHVRRMRVSSGRNAFDFNCRQEFG